MTARVAFILAGFVTLTLSSLCCAQAPKGVGAPAAAKTTAKAAPEDYLHAKPEALQRWREMRFGMFIHWGPVSLKGTEIGWSRAGLRRGHRSGRATKGVPVEVYDNLYKQFNPVRFDADEWVRIAKAAGMKYMVFTTKHHDGFVNFETKLTDYKITSPASPYGKDIVRQLADACHAGGLALGFYYSPPDWHHPDYRNGDRHAKYIEYLHGQLRELCSNYDKVDIIWFDGLGGTEAHWNSRPLFKLIRTLQPDVVINNRAGLPGDFYTPEQHIGGFDREKPWETCMTICRQWAWKPKDNMKSLAQCLHTLIRTAGGDGNLLFNVGPMPDGRIEPRQVERLREMGAWLAKYGQSIYATRGGPFRPGRWGASTCRDDRVYLHVLDWGGKDTLELPPLDREILSARLMTGGDVDVKQTAEGLAITVAEADQKAIDTVIELKLDGSAEDIRPLSNRSVSGSLAFGKKARASNVYRKQVKQLGPEKALDDDPATRWATDAGTKTASLQVDLYKPTVIGRAVIMEAYAGRVQLFELQYQDGQQWKTFARGTTLGEKKELTFEPVTARRVRLNILKATEGPTIWEFRLFGPEGGKKPAN